MFNINVKIGRNRYTVSKSFKVENGDYQKFYKDIEVFIRQVESAMDDCGEVVSSNSGRVCKRIIGVGYAVNFRLFNRPEQKFYGPVRRELIVAVDFGHKTGNYLTPIQVESGLWIGLHELKG